MSDTEGAKVEGGGEEAMRKRDGAKDLYAYVSAARKQGAKLLVQVDPPRTPKEAKRRAARIRAALKASN